MDTRLSERSRALLAELTAKTITLDEFLLECAKWTAELVDEFKFKPLPARPEEMNILDEVPEHQRNMLPREFYDTHPQILNYVRTRDQIHWENKSLYGWLMECRKILVEHEEIDSAAKIDEKIKEFTQ